MKIIAIALAAVVVSGSAWAQSVGGGGFTPPSSVPNLQNLGGVIGGLSTGTNRFSIDPVRAIPALNGAAASFQLGTDTFFTLVRPQPN